MRADDGGAARAEYHVTDGAGVGRAQGNKREAIAGRDRGYRGRGGDAGASDGHARGNGATRCAGDGDHGRAGRRQWLQREKIAVDGHFQHTSERRHIPGVVAEGDGACARVVDDGYNLGPGRHACASDIGSGAANIACALGRKTGVGATLVALDRRSIADCGDGARQSGAAAGASDGHRVAGIGITVVGEHIAAWVQLGQGHVAGNGEIEVVDGDRAVVAPFDRDRHAGRGAQAGAILHGVGEGIGDGLRAGAQSENSGICGVDGVAVAAVAAQRERAIGAADGRAGAHRAGAAAATGRGDRLDVAAIGIDVIGQQVASRADDGAGKCRIGHRRWCAVDVVDVEGDPVWRGIRIAGAAAVVAHLKRKTGETDARTIGHWHKFQAREVGCSDVAASADGNAAQGQSAFQCVRQGRDQYRQQRIGNAVGAVAKAKIGGAEGVADVFARDDGLVSAGRGVVGGADRDRQRRGTGSTAPVGHAVANQRHWPAVVCHRREGIDAVGVQGKTADTRDGARHAERAGHAANAVAADRQAITVGVRIVAQHIAALGATVFQHGDAIVQGGRGAVDWHQAIQAIVDTVGRGAGVLDVGASVGQCIEPGLVDNEDKTHVVCAVAIAVGIAVRRGCSERGKLRIGPEIKATHHAAAFDGPADPAEIGGAIDRQFDHDIIAGKILPGRPVVNARDVQGRENEVGGVRFLGGSRGCSVGPVCVGKTEFGHGVSCREMGAPTRRKKG